MWIHFCYLSNVSFSQTNCSNPIQVDICPSVMLTGQTNAGMLDDAPIGCNITGEDLVYEIFAPNGADKIYFAVVNASSPLNISLETSCGSGLCQSTSVGAGNTNGSFSVTPSSYYYVWVDAPGTVTFDISFGADTGTTIINIPNTQGNLQLDGSPCATPVFNATKPIFQVTYNGVYQTNPMTLAPLFSPGTLCVKTFFKNTTGIEGVKKFTFQFNPAGFPTVTNNPSTVPGHYNFGNWIGSASGNDRIFNFVDALGIGKGDFTGFPNTCLSYEFCFTVIPISNNPLLTDVKVTVLSDGFGMGYNGPVHLGCCPIPYINCLPSGGGSTSGGAHAFGFGFADPGTLPIELVKFTAEPQESHVLLKWATASEKNNNYFTIERSVDSKKWEVVSDIEGAGNSNTNLNYQYTDKQPYQGISFYRLKQTDYDGAYSYSATEKVLIGATDDIMIYPNPSNLFLKIYGSNISKISLFNSIGGKTGIRMSGNNVYRTVDTSVLPSGVYLIVIEKENGTVKRERLVISHNLN